MFFAAIGASALVVVLLLRLLVFRKADVAHLTEPQAIARLNVHNRTPLPNALAASTPRPDVFSGRGYLAQERYCKRYLDLLRHGYVTRGICVSYESSNDGEGNDVCFTYLWVDHRGAVKKNTVTESYDPLHAAYAAGQGNIVIDMDAGVELESVLTIVYNDKGEHVVVDALGVIDDPGDASDLPVLLAPRDQLFLGRGTESGRDHYPLQASLELGCCFFYGLCLFFPNVFKQLCNHVR